MQLKNDLCRTLASVACGGSDASTAARRPRTPAASPDAADRRQTVARCERVLACMPLAVIEVGSGRHGLGRVEYWGGAAQTLFGWRADEAIGCTLDELMLHELGRVALEMQAQRLAVGMGWIADAVEVSGTTRSGQPRHWRLYLPHDASTATTRPTHVLVVEDVTERVTAQREARRLSEFDTLTGLPNRTLLERRLEQGLGDTLVAGGRLGLALIDVDDFKFLNLSFGHAAGDELLRAIAARLRDAAQPSDTIARLEGAKFAALWVDAGGAADAKATPRRLAHALTPPYALDGQEIEVRTSLGTTLSPDDGATSKRLFRNAEMALHRAKRAGGGRIEDYSREIEEEVSVSREVQRGLRTALEGDAFELVYQPLYEVASGRTAQVEALLRWPHAGRYVPPSTFIPIAESTGLISALGEWVLRAACRQAAAWYRSGLDRRVAINVSAAQLRHGELYDHVRRALRVNHLPPNRLELELTESVFLDPSKDAILRLLQRLADLGVTLAIDDFGAGYSSLAYLKYFPFHKVKIDGSFVRDIGRDVEGEAIVTAVIALSHSLGKRVVGEGVETAEQLAFLRRSRCDFAQGYYLGKPQNAAQLDASPALH